MKPHEIDALVRAIKCVRCGAEPGAPCVVVQTNQPRIGQPTSRMHIGRYYAMWDSWREPGVVG